MSSEVVIVGSGYTGLSAAITLAKAGRKVTIIEAGDPGCGASSRNTGSMGRTFRHKFSALLERYGAERAIALYGEVSAAHEYASGLIRGEGIECDFESKGRFTGAVTPNHFKGMAKELDVRRRYLDVREFLVPESEQGAEIGFKGYHGGLVVPDVNTIHPGRYHLGLLEVARRRGVDVVANTRVNRIARRGDRFLVHTDRGECDARAVIVATNGYTSSSTRYLQRRVIPFPAFIMATEALDPGVVRAILPSERVFQESKGNPFFMRRTPDGTRFLFGGLTGSGTSDLKGMAGRLREALVRMVPALSGVRVARAWTGRCAATFDIFPHLGVHDGVHYAMGYCFAGISMGTYLGHKIALRALGDSAGATAFDAFPFQSRMYHWGKPWFLPLAVEMINREDRAGTRRSRVAVAS